jgi:hypothetical protein
MTYIFAIIATLFCLQIAFAGIYVYGVFHKWTFLETEKYKKLNTACCVLITLILLIAMLAHY